ADRVLLVEEELPLGTDLQECRALQIDLHAGFWAGRAGLVGRDVAIEIADAGADVRSHATGREVQVERDTAVERRDVVAGRQNTFVIREGDALPRGELDDLVEVV